MKTRFVMQIGLALLVLFGLSGSADAAEKVKAVLLWHALAHNMTRLWSLAPA